jgi:hypothetical protein
MFRPDEHALTEHQLIIEDHPIMVEAHPISMEDPHSLIDNIHADLLDSTLKNTQLLHE